MAFPPTLERAGAFLPRLRRRARSFLRAVTFCCACLAAINDSGATVSYEVLQSFQKPGTQIVAPLVLHSDGNYYGTATVGGAYGLGTVFKVTPAGVFTTLHSFAGADGSGSTDGLVEGADQALYGTTTSGGTGNFGVVFKITTAGVFTKLTDFTGTSGAARGSVPGALMRHANGNFYGVTLGGGTGSLGTVFSMTPAGVVTTLVDFTGTTGARPGSQPVGPLVASGALLYGMTKVGGASSSGTIFEVSTAGAWRLLGEFTGTAGVKPGSSPAGGLFLDPDGSLYGTTEYGGTNTFGVAFKITTAVTPVYTVLRHFADPTGSQPVGSFVKGADGLLYGVTAAGGTGAWGTAYKISTTGTHTVLANFTGSTGAMPGAAGRAGFVIGADAQFYTLTSAGGPGNLGQFFKVNSTGTFTALGAVSLPAGWSPNGAPVPSGNGALLFPLAAGGTGGGGNIASLSTSGAVTTVSALGGTLGSVPDGALRAAGSVFYGLCAQGGVSARGTMFRYTPGTGSSLVLAYTTSGGSLAEGALQLGADGLYYGVGREGGASSRGSIYKITTTGTRTRIASLTGTAGAAPGGKPRGPLVLASDGNFYGMAEEGGTANTGVIFRVTAAGAYSAISQFGATGARSPQGGFVIGSDGALYGTTSLGGTSDTGTLIRFVPATGLWSIIGEFTGTSGAVPGRAPAGELFAAADGSIYGIATAGGALDQGVVFRYTTTGGLETLVSFTGADGAAPGSGSANDGAGLVFTGGLATGSDGMLYGVAPGGGSAGGGVAFRLTFSAPIADWKLSALGDANAPDLGDPDYDGMPNVLEYALLTSPDIADSDFLPAAAIFTYLDGDWLTLIVPRDPARNDVTLIVEASDTLLPGSWTTLATSTLGGVFSGPGYFAGDDPSPGVKQVIVRDLQPFSVSDRRFIRIRVTH